ncbi:hypothetical protein Q7O_003645 [Pectobacterium carotovorum subsp. carotovorum PCCS1]|nr:hypothetical protein [Pectobacterium carotovorum subsp. carotovorum PCCS1]
MGSVNDTQEAELNPPELFSQIHSQDALIWPALQLVYGSRCNTG